MGSIRQSPSNKVHRSVITFCLNLLLFVLALFCLELLCLIYHIMYICAVIFYFISSVRSVATEIRKNICVSHTAILGPDFGLGFETCEIWSGKYCLGPSTLGRRDQRSWATPKLLHKSLVKNTLPRKAACTLHITTAPFKTRQAHPATCNCARYTGYTVPISAGRPNPGGLAPGMRYCMLPSWSKDTAAPFDNQAIVATF